jgi:hypothetical protein
MTALFCIIFADVTSTWAVMLSSIGFNLSSTVSSPSSFLQPDYDTSVLKVMWAILYGWTPDIFEPKGTSIP